MAWQSNLYAIPLLVVSALLIIFALIAWRRDSTLGVTLFFIYAIFVAGLMIAYALQLMSADLQIILFWVKIKHIFYCLPVIWLLFVTIYTNHGNWLTPRNIAILFFIPAFQAIAAWTNEFHGLYWQAVGTATIDGAVTFQTINGPLFYVGMLYLYLIVALSVVIMVGSIIRAPSFFRGQIAWLLAGVFMPVLGNLLTITGLSDTLHFDTTPIGFALVCLPIGWNLFRQNLFDIVPAAYGKIVRSMSDAIIVLNAENKVVDLNPAAEALTHIPASVAIGKSVREAFPQAPDLLTRYRDAPEAQVELEFNEGSSKLFLDMRLSSIYNRSGKMTGRVIVLRDITQSKKAEETIRQYAVELETSNNELDAFSHTVAHDLKAPIGIIMGYTHILQQHEQLEPTVIKYVQNIEKAAGRMENMITGLLLLARLRNISDIVTPVDMTQAAKGATERFQGQMEERGIKIEIMEQMPPAMGHDIWLEEVFANLIGNAVKYIGRENPAPCISVKGYRQGQIVRYEVEDNGMGISQENQAKLFDMFSRFHTHEATGAGLGLSIFLRIVTRLKGEVGVTSEPDAGSTFWFTLPAADEMPQSS